MNTVFFFIVVSLVCWRITHLLHKEDGPFDIVFLLRKKAGAGFFGGLLDCFYCISLWTALPLGIWLGTTVTEMLLFWWAISGAACLLEQGTAKNVLDKKDEIPVYEED